MDSPPLHRPTPRRPYDLPPDFARSSSPPPKRTKSAVSLTSSTLFGIYSPTYDDATPAISRNPSTLNLPSLRSREESTNLKRHRPPPTIGKLLPYLLLRVGALFAFGVAYGVIVTHFHDRSPLSPKQSAGVEIELEHGGWAYLVLWGLAGVGLGNLLPWIDGREGEAEAEGEKQRRGWAWHPAVRSVGAFVGIAYAIVSSHPLRPILHQLTRQQRKLPWQSTLQVSLALALVNPFLWFVVDRTRSGFWFATLVGIAGTVFLMQTSPGMIAVPDIRHEPTMVAGLVSSDSIAMITWIASVLFCSCVCFGNIGRKLAVKERSTR